MVVIYCCYFELICLLKLNYELSTAAGICSRLQIAVPNSDFHDRVMVKLSITVALSKQKLTNMIPKNDKHARLIA